MYIIFPFEVDFYRKHNIEVEYRGNPLLDETEKKLMAFTCIRMISGNHLDLGDKPVIAMLAGSRKSEVRDILPSMLKAVRHFPDYQFVLAGVKNLPDELYNRIIGKNPV